MWLPQHMAATHATSRGHSTPQHTHHHSPPGSWLMGGNRWVYRGWVAADRRAAALSMPSESVTPPSLWLLFPGCCGGEAGDGWFDGCCLGAVVDAQTRTAACTSCSAQAWGHLGACGLLLLLGFALCPADQVSALDSGGHTLYIQVLDRHNSAEHIIAGMCEVSACQT